MFAVTVSQVRILFTTWVDLLGGLGRRFPRFQQVPPLREYGPQLELRSVHSWRSLGHLKHESEKSKIKRQCALTVFPVLAIFVSIKRRARLFSIKKGIDTRSHWNNTSRIVQDIPNGCIYSTPRFCQNTLSGPMYKTHLLFPWGGAT